MAYKIEKETEQNVDTPLTQFPVGEDTFDRMMDVTSALMPLVSQYNAYFQSGNITACNNLIKNNPDLLYCFFNAEKYNQIRDAMIAVQRYQLNQVDDLYNTIAQNALGINDRPTEEQASLVAYSAEKINRLHKKRNIQLLADNWSDSYPYTQTVSVEGITQEDDLKVIGTVHEDGNTEAQDKAIDKAAGFLMHSKNGIGQGTVTFRAKKKPVTDFTVITEGG